MLRSYPHIYALGHHAIVDLLADPVVVQEKVDGSQFSFGVLPDGLCFRSKGVVVSTETPDKLFAPAAATARELYLAGRLHEGWVYRGEAFSKPKHNTLAYARVPRGNVVIFDIDTGLEAYQPASVVQAETAKLGLETVPTLFDGRLEGLGELEAFLTRESFLGGVLIEGVVIKNYHRFGKDGHALMGKFVSEAFKEKHAGDWRARNPARADVVERLIAEFNTVPRWEKAVQHLRDAGQLAEAPADIGRLLKEVQMDVAGEETAYIKDVLFERFWRDISRGLVRGLPEWYKEKLAEKQFSD